MKHLNLEQSSLKVAMLNVHVRQPLLWVYELFNDLSVMKQVTNNLSGR